MPITKQQLMSTLEMYIDDYVIEDDDVLQTEMDDIKKKFDNIWNQLREEATPSEEDK